MKTNKTNSTTPTPAAVEAAKREAARRFLASIDIEAMNAEAADLETKAAEATESARALTAEYLTAKAAADEAADLAEVDLIDSEDDPEDVRALFRAAATARQKAARLTDRAEAAREAADHANENAARIVTGREVVTICRMKTAADYFAEEAAAKYREISRDPAALLTEIEAAEKTMLSAKKAAKEAAPAAPRFGFFMGAVVNEDRPAAAVSFGHKIAADLLNVLGLSTAVARVSVSLNAADPALMLSAARAVAKRSATNAVLRQGTDTQWSIYFDALSGRWDAHDLSDMTAAAVDPLLFAAAPADMLTDEKRIAAAMHEAAAKLAKLSPADTIARAAVMKTARKATGNDPRLIEDPRKLIARAAVVDLAAEAVAALAAADSETARAEAVHLLTRAAFAAVNNYLGDCRAIRAAATVPTVDLDSIAETVADPRSIDPDSVSEYEARKRETIRAALPVAREALTEAQEKTLAALIKTGGNEVAAARKLKRERTTIRQHRAAVARAFAAAVATVAPDSIEDDVFRAIAEAAEIEAAAATAEIKARRDRAKAAAAKENAARAVAAADLAEEAAAAIRAALDAMPPAMRETADLLQKGHSKRAAAEIMQKNEKTVREAAKAAAARIVAALIKAAPEFEKQRETLEAADLAALLKLAGKAV